MLEQPDDEVGVARNAAADRIDLRPHLLFLAQLLPYPPDAGASIRTYHLMRLLSHDFRVTALCFFRRKTRSTREAVRASVEGLGAIARIRAYPIPQEHSRRRLVWDHLRSIVKRRVYTRFVHDSSAFRTDLKNVIQAEHVDLIHMDSLDLAAYLPELTVAPIVCGHHNVESLLLKRRSAAATPRIMRSYLAYQAERMEEEERIWAERCALNVVVSPADLAVFRRLAPRAKFLVVPNGVDTASFKPSEEGEKAGIAFVGGYGWLPNRDALEFFCKDILPHVRKRRDSVRVEWLGRAPEPIRKRYAQRYDVTLTGYVNDIRPYVLGAACYIVPIRIGGGTRLKILDAWAMGKAVVSTSTGCEGLAARDGQNILIREDPQSFADAIERVLGDSALRRRLGEAARRTAVEQYDWKVIGKPMLDAYLELLSASGG